MKIGLIDVDGHHYPNMALMRISAYHKMIGDDVGWWLGDLFHYDRVYMSKVFSNEYSPDIPEPMNADEVIKGGTGYAIQMVNGREVYDKSKDPDLPPEIEAMPPDYSIYPQYTFCLAQTSRGCPRNCPFCHVTAKEGRCSRKTDNIDKYYNGQKIVDILDPNITACKDKTDLLRQYLDTGATIKFSQGLDIRLLTEEDIDLVNRMKVKDIHFAWDNSKEDLKHYFERYKAQAKHKPHGSYGTVYCLTNYNSTMEENLYRIYTLRDMGFDPYVMIYDKPNAPLEIRRLQAWCNNVRLFRTIPNFYDCRFHDGTLTKIARGEQNEIVKHYDKRERL